MSKTVKDIINKHSIFSLLPDDAQNELAAIGKTILFKADEKLIREGEFNPYLFLIIDGTVYINASGKTITSLSGHKILGEISASGMGSPIADVTAKGHVVAFAFPIDAIINTLIKYDDFAEKIRALGMKHAESH